MSTFKKYQPETLGALLCLSLGILSGYGVQAGDSSWYLSLHKPIFNPPAWIFGPVWTILYIMMGIAVGKLWKQKNQHKYLVILFTIQFIFNLLWSPLFFYFERIDLALVDICALWVSLMMLIISVRNQKTIFLLLLPYTLWVSFALFLNFTLYQMNSV